MVRLVTYLRFNGNCRQAMEFYRDCLGGKLKIMTVGESPMAAQMPAMKDKVMHSWLESDTMTLMASDMAPKEGLVKGNTTVLSLVAPTKAEVEGYYTRLSAGGKIDMPLGKTFFGVYGGFVDKFGVEWMVQADKE